jgi:hypothetical protein
LVPESIAAQPIEAIQAEESDDDNDKYKLEDFELEIIKTD